MQYYDCRKLFVELTVHPSSPDSIYLITEVMKDAMPMAQMFRKGIPIVPIFKLLCLRKIMESEILRFITHPSITQYLTWQTTREITPLFDSASIIHNKHSLLS